MCIVNKPGFTLIELLIGIAIIGVLAGIVIVAINPFKQIGDARDAERYAMIREQQNAVIQYQIDQGQDPATGVPTGETNAKKICRAGVTDASCVNIDTLVTGDFLAALPLDIDETDVLVTGYRIYKDSGSRTTVCSDYLTDTADARRCSGSSAVVSSSSSASSIASTASTSSSSAATSSAVATSSSLSSAALSSFTSSTPSTSSAASSSSGCASGLTCTTEMACAAGGGSPGNLCGPSLRCCMFPSSPSSTSSFITSLSSSSSYPSCLLGDVCITEGACDDQNGIGKDPGQCDVGKWCCEPNYYATSSSSPVTGGEDPVFSAASSSSLGLP